MSPPPSDSPDSPTPHELGAYRSEVDWSYLRPHYQDGRLYHVDRELNLEAVGEAFRADHTTQVSAWLRSGQLTRIEELHAAQWEPTEGQSASFPCFEALIVSPFVLCQLRDPAS